MSRPYRDQILICHPVKKKNKNKNKKPKDPASDQEKMARDQKKLILDKEGG